MLKYSIIFTFGFNIVISLQFGAAVRGSILKFL